MVGVFCGTGMLQEAGGKRERAWGSRRKRERAWGPTIAFERMPLGLLLRIPLPCKSTFEGQSASRLQHLVKVVIILTRLLMILVLPRRNLWSDTWGQCVYLIFPKLVTPWFQQSLITLVESALSIGGCNKSDFSNFVLSSLFVILMISVINPSTFYTILWWKHSGVLWTPPEHPLQAIRGQISRLGSVFLPPFFFFHVSGD